MSASSTRADRRVAEVMISSGGISTSWRAPVSATLPCSQSLETGCGRRPSDPQSKFTFALLPARWNRGKPYASVAKGAVDLGTGEKKQQESAREETSERFKELLLGLRARLRGQVKGVRLSGWPTLSPACLVGEAGDGQASERAGAARGA